LYKRRLHYSPVSLEDEWLREARNIDLALNKSVIEQPPPRIVEQAIDCKIERTAPP
jgi:hypothetical protein